MSDTTAVVIEKPASKVRTFVKKITPTPEQLKAGIIGAGIALAGTALAATAFAFKRSDESDFDDEFEPAEESFDDGDTIVIHEN